MLTDQLYFNRVFKLSYQGLGFVGPKPLWAIVLVKENRIIAEAYLGKYGDQTPLQKLQEFDSETDYYLYTNLLFDFDQLGKLKPHKIFYCNSIATKNFDNLKTSFENAGIQLEQKLEEEGKQLNKAFFYFKEHQIPYSKKIDHSLELNSAIRSGFDCVVFDHEIVKKSNDDFRAFNNRTPLRVLLCPFEKLDFSWKVLSDEVRRNTMVITTHDDVKKNPEVVKRLEQQGIAQLSLTSVEEQEILKTLARYKFISVLFEV